MDEQNDEKLMKILYVKETSNYTGIVVTGSHCYAYFPALDNKIIIDPRWGYFRTEPYSYILEAVYNFVLGRFIIYDLSLYYFDDKKVKSHPENFAQDNYSLILEAYTQGNLIASITINIGRLDKNTEKYALSVFITGLITGLGEVIAQQKNIKIEYIWMRRSGKLMLCNSTSVTYAADFSPGDINDFRSAFGISFDTPPEFAKFNNERILQLESITPTLSWNHLNQIVKPEIHFYMHSGYILPAPKENILYLFNMAEDGMLSFRTFDGEKEFGSNPPKKVSILSLQDAMSGNII